MTKVNTGVDLIANAIGNSLGFGGTATATSATTLTGTGFTINAYIGQIVSAAGVYGVIISNTTTVLTVERWVNPASPGGAAGTTPGNVPFTITPGQAPACFMALTANVTAPNVTDTVLTGEIATAGGGLIRKLAAYAHTPGTATYTEGATFTGNGSDVYSVIIHKMGAFPTLTSSTGILVYETTLSADATLNASGDQVTVTQTVTIS